MFRSRWIAVMGVVGLVGANGGMTVAVFHAPGANADEAVVAVAVLTAVLWQLAWRCTVVITQDTLRVHYLSCYREVPLSHFERVAIEGGDLVITTAAGQRIKPWPYLASVAGALTGYRQKKAVRDAVAARVDHAEPAECAERHGLKWEFDGKAVAAIASYYVAVVLMATSR
ncbi:hypothetical protein [Catenulispora acidiphila]|nr:hypothetical protein [Catenulispora acidiphila]